MRIALISDIHANIVSLEAVLDDIDARNVEKIICLGDVVGYGPWPIECADLVMKRCELTICGNHDEALTLGAVGFNPIAKEAIDWTAGQLKPGIFSGPSTRKRWDYLTKLAKTHTIGGDLFIHGSPIDFTSDYILPGDIAFGKSSKMEAIFDAIGERLFVGHTHLPMVMTEDCEVHLPKEIDHSWTSDPGRKEVINVGSVGQPRDGDPRACYVIVDGAEITWHRVEYDLMKTVKRIEAVGTLDERLGKRLITGQ